MSFIHEFEEMVSTVEAFYNKHLRNGGHKPLPDRIELVLQRDGIKVKLAGFSPREQSIDGADKEGNLTGETAATLTRQFEETLAKKLEKEQSEETRAVAYIEDYTKRIAKSQDKQKALRLLNPSALEALAQEAE